MKIAISASKCCIRHFEALFILFILHIAGRRFPPHLNFICIYLFIADGYPIDRLLDDEAILRVRHCVFIIFCIF